MVSVFFFIGVSIVVSVLCNCLAWGIHNVRDGISIVVSVLCNCLDWGIHNVRDGVSIVISVLCNCHTSSN